MSVEPLLTRAMLFEVYALGDRGIAGHRETHHKFTEQLLELAARARETDDSIRDISYASAAAVVGAIYQLIQMATEEEPRVSIDEARVAATELVLAMAAAHLVALTISRPYSRVAGAGQMTEFAGSLPPGGSVHVVSCILAEQPANARWSLQIAFPPKNKICPKTPRLVHLRTERVDPARWP